MAKTSKQKVTSNKPPVGANKQSPSSPKQPAKPTRTQRPQVDKDEKDKEIAAAHEAGHFVVALVQGFVVRAGIWKTESMKWIGQTRVLGDLSTPAAFVAGLVAQWMWDAPDDDWLSDDYQAAFDIALRSNPEMHTATDIKVLPKSQEEREAAIEDAVNILRNHREFFQWVQQQLDKKGSIDVENVVDYCRQHRSLKWVRFLEQTSLTADEWGRGVTKQARTKKVTTPKKKPKAKHQKN
jgi:hypothetical protein